MNKLILANIISALMCLIFGALIKYGKMYDLIAGYNTASEEEKKKINIVGLGNFVGGSLIVLAIVLIAGVVLELIGLSGAGGVSWILFTLIIFYLVIKAQAFKNT